MRKTMKIIAATAIIILLLSALIFDSRNMTGAVVASIETCLYTIIPALFGFMAISSYLLRSGLYRILFKPLFMIFRHVTKLSEEEFGIFLLSLFGGYPVGAKLISERRGNHRSSGISSDAQCAPLQKLLPFCYCPSPGFVISVVGIGLFANAKVGFAVYLSNMAACVVIAVLCRGGRLCPPAKIAISAGGHGSPPLQLNSFTPAVLSASSALFPVCAVVVAFGVIRGALQFIGLESRLLFAFLEVSNTSALAPNPALLPLIAALFSTGGLCILMQIPALTAKRIPLRGFFLWRIPAAVLSALFCRIFMFFIDFTAYVPASTDGISVLPSQAGSPVASACLLIMAVILVRTAGEERHAE
jgi:hypothetical protein